MRDELESMGRERVGKRRAGDRLVKQTLGTLYYQLPHSPLVQRIAAALHYRSEQDPQAQELAALIAEKGVKAALVEISGLDADSEVVASAVAAYQATA